MSPAADWAETRYSVALLVMTAATGAVDAVSYLSLDRVFTGNMTGNVLFLAFGLLGIEDIPVINNLVALLAFMVGAVVASRIVRNTTEPWHLPTRSVVVLICTTAGTAAVAIAWLIVGSLPGPLLAGTTGVLALLLGAQAAAVKTTGIRDLSTVVVTMTMVNLSTDSRLAGGTGNDWARRLLAIVAMCGGAFIGAIVCIRGFGALALLVAAAIMVVGTVLLVAARRREIGLSSLAP